MLYSAAMKDGARNMIATYHNHSNRSDGRTAIAEIVSFAQRLGIDELGISDHFCMLPTGETSGISLPLHGLTDYVREVVSCQKEGPPAVRVGIEIDWFERQGDAIRKAVEALPFDYRIGGVHYVQQEEIDKNAAYWRSKTQHERDAVYRIYWRSIREMAESGLFDIAAHLDLPKKFGYHAQADMSHPIRDALAAIARHRLVVELNTSGFRKACADAYPSLDILRMCRRRDIPVTLSADAHRPRHILHAFGRGIHGLEAAGYSEIACFKRRQACFEPLKNVRKDLQRLRHVLVDGKLERR